MACVKISQTAESKQDFVASWYLGLEEWLAWKCVVAGSWVDIPGIQYGYNLGSFGLNAGLRVKVQILHVIHVTARMMKDDRIDDAVPPRSSSSENILSDLANMMTMKAKKVEKTRSSMTYMGTGGRRKVLVQLRASPTVAILTSNR